MYKQRDFLEDSDDSSSFDGEPGTPPPFYQKAEAQFNPAELGFKIGDSGVQNVDLVGDYFERQHAAERKIDYGDDLLGIRQDQSEDSSPSVQNRPVSALMRQKMLEQQKNKLQFKSPFAGQTNELNILQEENRGSNLTGHLYSNQIYNDQDLSNNRHLKEYGAQNHTVFEPQVQRQDGSLPQPLSQDIVVFKDEESKFHTTETEQSEVSLAPPIVIGDTYQEINIERSQPPIQFAPQERQIDIDIKYQPQPETRQYYTQPPVQQPIQQEPVYERKASLQTDYGENAPEILTNQQYHVEQTRGGPQEEEKRSSSNYFVREIHTAMQDLWYFVTHPLPSHRIVQFTVRRDRSGFGRWYPKYFMHLQEDLTFVLAAKKRGGNATPNYLISLDQKDLSVKSKGYVAKLRSNFAGTVFHLYTPGLNPKDKKATLDKIREELAVILYEANFMGANGPRKMQILLPTLDQDNNLALWKPQSENLGMHMAYKGGNHQKMKVFYNKPPVWSERAQQFILNFNGRVDRASVKNFQMIAEHNPDDVILQFGRVDDHMFSLDFKYPITPIQAFGIALSSLDNKFACE